MPCAAAVRIWSGMTYTIWHAGIMIGESAFDHPNPNGNPLQRAAIFAPTTYGRTLLPRLTGLLTAAADLKDHLESEGLDPERLDPGTITDMLDTTPGGRMIVDVGRTLSEVEIRDARSRPLRFKQIAFIDMQELGALHRRVAPASSALDGVPHDAPYIVVSATLEPGCRW